MTAKMLLTPMPPRFHGNKRSETRRASQLARIRGPTQPIAPVSVCSVEKDAVKNGNGGANWVRGGGSDRHRALRNATPATRTMPAMETDGSGFRRKQRLQCFTHRVTEPPCWLLLSKQQKILGDNQYRKSKTNDNGNQMSDGTFT